MRRFALLALIGAVLVIMPLSYLSLLSSSSRPPAELGAADGKLAIRDPSKPNWVSTYTESGSHAMEPLPCDGASPSEALDRLEQLILTIPRARIVARSDNYLHAEFRSLIFRFVDDAEFLVSPDGKTIQFTSAARSGHSDFGVNRQRIAFLRQALAKNSE